MLHCSEKKQATSWSRENALYADLPPAPGQLSFQRFGKGEWLKARPTRIKLLQKMHEGPTRRNCDDMVRAERRRDH